MSLTFPLLLLSLSSPALSWAMSLTFPLLPLSLSSSVSLESLESLICWYRLLLLFDFFFTGISVVPSCCLLLFLFGVLVSVSLSSSVSIVALVLRFRFCLCTLGSGRFACSLTNVSLCCPGVVLFLCFALFSLSLSLVCLCRFFVFVISWFVILFSENVGLQKLWFLQLN